MKSLHTRVAALFAITALLPVVLTAIVWSLVTTWGDSRPNRSAALAREALATMAEQRAQAIQSLCKDSLLVDLLLEERSGGTVPNLDLGRQVRSAMRGSGLQGLWVLDANSGELIASGEPKEGPGTDGPTLLGESRNARGRDFVVGTKGEHRLFIAAACTIKRGGTGITLIGAHRLAALRSLAPDDITLRETPDEGELPVMELLDADGSPAGFLVWRTPESANTPPLWLWAGCVALLALGIALVFGGHLYRWIQSAMDEFTVAATRIGAGDLGTTLREEPGGAFKATATAFNRMTRDLQSAQEQLRQTERIAAWQDIAKRLAHELKNPLSPIRLSIETLRKARSRTHEEFDTLFEETTRTILDEVERLRHIIDEFSRFARLPTPVRSDSDLGEIASQVVSLYADHEVAVSMEAPSEPVVAYVDSEQIAQVLHNLLGNAVDAAKDAHPRVGGAVRVSLDVGPDEAHIRVDDNGVGVPEAERSLIFEPYYTNKAEGSGLGLAISHRIVHEHGGSIRLASTSQGTTFTVSLPRHDPSSAPTRIAPAGV